MSTTTEQLEARAHHPRSPSTLANREACPCYESRNTAHVRSIAGTLAHAVVETGQDNPELSDEDATAAVECMDFVERRRLYLAEDLKLGPIEVLRELHLPVDTCAFPDAASTTAGFVDHTLLALEAFYAEMFDYKFGVWEVEDAQINLQGIAYVLGGFHRWPEVNTIKFFFKQPLIDSLSEHTFKRSDIPALYLRVQTVVARAREANTLLGVNWEMAKPSIPVCNFCNRLGQCPKVLEIALKVGKKFHPAEIPDNITPSMIMEPAQSKKAMLLAQVVQCWASAYKTQLTNRVLEGRAEMPEGFAFQSRQNRTLADKDAFKREALKHMTELEFNDTLDVLFGAVEKRISDKAPRGAKKETLEQFRDALERAGATKKGDPYTFLKAESKKKV